MPVQLVRTDAASVRHATVNFAGEISDGEVIRIAGDNPGYCVERIGREQIVVSQTGTESGGRAAKVFTQVAMWAEASRDGEYFGPDTGFQLSDGSILSPDVAWVSNTRLDAVEGPDREGFCTLCPDLAIEVASESDSRPYLREKCRRWIHYGASTVVLVDPQSRSTEIYQPGQPTVNSESSTIEVPGFPGLVLKLERVWQGLRRNR